MAYRHYWTITKRFTQEQWDAFTSEACEVILNSKIPLSGFDGRKTTRPVVDSNKIYLNGVESDSYEPLLINKKDEDFDFCDTNKKPYDEIVVKLLLLAREHNPNIILSSDGGPTVFN